MQRISRCSYLAVMAVVAGLTFTSVVAIAQQVNHGTHQHGMSAGTAPTSPGQDAFGAIQETVGLVVAAGLVLAAALAHAQREP